MKQRSPIYVALIFTLALGVLGSHHHQQRAVGDLQVGLQ
jgi:hypothetical protein